ncbi:MAG: hypothetical protein JFAIHJKO_02882 [Pyrinomonadaceae bacterium]|nr:hypothetical protein [Pyrinomonadaceae bacterium]
MLIRENLSQSLFGAIGEIPVGRNIDILNVVVPNEQLTDLGELAANEGFAAREIQVLKIAEFKRQFLKFLVGEIIAFIQFFPVKAVLARQITDRVDENYHEWRRLMCAMLDRFHR